MMTQERQGALFVQEQEPGPTWANEAFADVRAAIQEASDQIGATSEQARVSGVHSLDVAIDGLRYIKTVHFGEDAE